VTLEATPDANSRFAGWSGACSGTSTCTISLAIQTSVTATFGASAPPATVQLTVATSGTGTGTVTSVPEGINCGLTCSAAFPTGTSVLLTATPSAGSTFTGWTGACSGTAPCSLTLVSNTSVEANLSAASTGEGLDSLRHIVFMVQE
jgi:hypothetical protein